MLNVECFLEIYKTREDCVFVLVDVFLNEDVEGVDVVSGSLLWSFSLSLSVSLSLCLSLSLSLCLPHELYHTFPVFPVGDN